jgi:tetratricopeptide (TPR) repeat protein
MGYSDDAFEAYEMALDVDPSFGPALLNKGTALAREGYSEEAVACFDRLIELDPLDAVVWLNRGVALSLAGMNAEALASLQEAERLGHPSARDAIEMCRREAAKPVDAAGAEKKRLVREGLRSADSERWDEAVQCFDRAVELAPDNDALRHVKGAALSEAGMYEAVDACFDEILRLRPDDAGAWSSKGFALAQAGKLPDALRAFDRSLEIRPSDPTTLLNKGTALTHLGLYAAARPCIEEALRLGHPRAKSTFEWFLSRAGVPSLPSNLPRP